MEWLSNSLSKQTSQRTLYLEHLLLNVLIAMHCLSSLPLLSDAMPVSTHVQPTAERGNVVTPTTWDQRRSWSRLFCLCALCELLCITIKAWQPSNTVLAVFFSQDWSYVNTHRSCMCGNMWFMYR